MKIGFIGAGKVGCSLGKYLAEHGVNIAGYYDRDEKAAEEGAQFTGTGAYHSLDALAGDCDCFFITVPDGLISSVYEQISNFDMKGKYLCHCSGSISSREAFPGAEEAGAYIYSIHPLFAVSDRFETYRKLADAFFTVEGSRSQIDDMRQMLENTGLRVRIIDPGDKARYHLAAVMISNLVLALVDSGVDKMKECGFTEADARRALRPLALGNLEHALDEGVVAALTGPVERGDVKTLEKHLGQIVDPEERKLYLLLSRRLLHIAGQKNPDRDYSAIEAFLDRQAPGGS